MYNIIYIEETRAKMVTIKRVAIVELIVLTIVSVLFYVSLSGNVPWLDLETMIDENITLSNQYALLSYQVNPTGKTIVVTNSASQVTSCSYTQVDNNNLGQSGGYCLVYYSLAMQLYLNTLPSIISQSRLLLALILIASIVANPVIIFIFTSRLCIKKIKNRSLIMCIVWAVVTLLSYTVVLLYHFKVREMLSTVQVVTIDAAQAPTEQSYTATNVTYSTGFWLSVATLFFSPPLLIFRVSRKIHKRLHSNSKSRSSSTSTSSYSTYDSVTVPIIHDDDGTW
ncbi:hypothetical protein DFA_09238 [Cavenderia fasciculata]|uniref:Transmembrane protein n=1 Tax=Cavenderia fasciculata TaxID=261658 RepID=F4Q726_CACFS|nr:uncharacterized protein DFA_09238 [Cavenderia fasciculata]EGG16208.1 hypothetical protein DFA_09238 [Cavenderia fasciculata]|eukprot:XP_004354592.1 hypothetical protein DFA_09238 [Cavenderia fasciculata]